MIVYLQIHFFPLSFSSMFFNYKHRRALRRGRNFSSHSSPKSLSCPCKYSTVRKNGDLRVHPLPRSQERESGDLGERWTFAQNIFETTAVNNTRWYPDPTSNFLTYLLGEPFVEFFTAVQHQAFTLGTFFTLCHQSGVVISFKQARHLKKTHS